MSRIICGAFFTANLSRNLMMIKKLFQKPINGFHLGAKPYTS